ncbi:hypothetical protein QR680_003708 [Steinernema hermaphroditum]|uniref:7TM GPCR serpentine receptor class x (Srx) domain-containing protein n=1 Tax=Steinernema hermaphroditum TaxID=289476 RepID=A0AA39HLB1_9BILA|nr:hypothetical protein QR680_003708 [Steinernema hermaphroditum]
MVTLFSLAVGLCYLILAAIFLVINGLFLLTLIINPEFKTNTYRIIKCMAVACLMQIFVFTISAFMTIMQTVFHYYVDRILGIVFQSGWLLYVSLSFALAMDRLFTFLSKARDYSIISNMLLVLSWIVWLTVVVILSMPGFGYSYGEYDFLLWDYTDETGSKRMNTIEPYYDMTIFGSAFVMYMFVFGRLMKLRHSSTVGFFTSEVKILIVAVIAFIYEVMLVMTSFWLLPFNTTCSTVIINFAWIIECGMFTSITLVINTSVRGRMVALVRGVKTTPVASREIA